MRNPKLKVASVSDIHVGHPNTPTVDILERLREAFPDTEETGQLDVIFIGGDFFDRSLSVYDPNVEEIQLWTHEFLTMCKRRAIAVRFLEGTPSHDWRQNRIFPLLNSICDIHADVKYLDTLCIDRMESLGIDVLWVPDEWRPETDDTWKEVCQLLKQEGLKQVDFTIIHGAFSFQLPSHVKAPTHVPERYLDITRHYVFGAHIHKHAQYQERLLVNGSFDRLNHGEEEDKGHWRVTLEKGQPDQLVFVINQNAKRYETINCKGLSTEKALALLARVEAYPPGSAVRVSAAKTDPILTSLDLLRKTYPLIEWSTKTLESKDVQKNLLTDMRSMFHEVNITKDNVLELLLPKLQGLTGDSALLAKCQGKLEELLS